MKFAIITQITHKKKGSQWFSYAPYIREMQLWQQYVSEIQIVSPISKEEIGVNEMAYLEKDIPHVRINEFDITNFKNILKAIVEIPLILTKIYREMKWADHIHLRCPGNVGLLGCFVQILFPKTPKTVKYAGNWDPKSRQPVSYRLQKWVLSNTFLTKNCKVLVYGNWKNQSRNIIPFFTASYSENEIKDIPEKRLNKEINLIFVGNFSKGKQPLKSVEVAEQLHNNGHSIKLNMYGEGVEFKNIESYVEKNSLNNFVKLHGNQSKETIKRAFQESHFLVFISKSEGWPKVVAEAMFWSCLPISTSVSCIPYMLGEGKRGTITKGDKTEIVQIIEGHLNNEQKYLSSVYQAKEWSQNYTIEKFSKAINELL